LSAQPNKSPMKNKAVAIYARVSTDKQKVDMQLSDLREYVERAEWRTIHKEFIDHAI
jgi:DNA invertase Pin-like site-specific DNA recombinase